MKNTKNLTINDIAKLAGVAKSTVSRYLNNGYVSNETAEKISSVIKTTGYKTNFFAQRIKNKDSKLIGVVVPRFNSYAASSVLASFSKLMEQQGFQLLILVSDLSTTTELRHMQTLINQGVDGILVHSLKLTSQHVQLTQSTSIPIVFTGQTHSKLSYVAMDDYAAGKLMGQYIALHRYQRAVFLGVTMEDKAVGKHRYEGFKAGYCDYYPTGNIYHVKTDFSFEAAYAMGDKALEHDPDVIVCATDNIALGILRYLQERGVQIPQDISLVGFGGYPVCNITYPSLTTLHFEYDYQGAFAGMMLLELMNGEKPKSCLLRNFSLFTRESTRSVMIEDRG